MEDIKKLSPPDREERGIGAFFRDLAVGMCIGVAFIIPGFSGGSVAAILGIYEKMVGAIANIFKEFKKSVITLLPIVLGLVIGAVSLLYPLGYFLERFPLPTVSIFVGLAIGGLRSMLGRVKGKPTSNDVIALSIPLVAAVLICFVPGAGDVELFNIGLGGYILLFLVGMIGSCALVVPGISGSMLLLILGYYKPLINLITDHLFKLKDIGACILVLGSCGAGMVLGFFLISVIMKKLLEKYPRGTFFAIIGFIIGSLPTVYVSTMKDAGMITDSFSAVSLPSSPLHYATCVFLLFCGICASYTFSTLTDKKAE